MADEGISEEVKRFISKCIDSVEMLEVLLLLRADPKKEWSIDSISSELRSNPASVAKRLKDLYTCGLLYVKESPTPYYRYNPRTAALDAVVTELARAYAERRARVIDLIFSKPIDTLRYFSDSFKFRKDD